jgi:hypothetical protein
MAESGESSSGGSQFNLTSVVALLTIVSGLFLVSRKLASDRPFLYSEKPENPRGDQMVEARLWEDPFKWKAAEAQTNGFGAFGYLQSQIIARNATSNSTLLHAVMVEGGTYSEDIESRLRSRFAVVSALGESGYAPEAAEHLGAGLLPWPEKKNIEGVWGSDSRSLLQRAGRRTEIIVDVPGVLAGSLG